MHVDVLVIGGSVFLGRTAAAEALARGDRVTVFNRGLSRPQLPGVTHLPGDRTSAADLDRLAERRFDLVVDTCGYVPADVGAAAARLRNAVGHYAFISSISVFPAWPEAVDYAARGAHVGSPDATRSDVPADLEPGQDYGWLKAGCERAVVEAFGAERCAVLRAGCIVGPEDTVVGRLPWWLDRAARGGPMLVPGSPGDPIALIDARDLARFALSGQPGTFECGGPGGRDTRARFVDALVAETGSDADPTWVESAWLSEQGVAYWTEVPLWIPPSLAAGTWAHHNDAAEAAGLRWRPLSDTVADTWAWQRTLDPPWRPTERTPGLAPGRERDLLAAWHAR